jgi:hypothetical protein
MELFVLTHINKEDKKMKKRRKNSKSLPSHVFGEVA